MSRTGTSRSTACPRGEAMAGFLIAFEGPDGSGKSTVAGQVASRLEGDGVHVLVTREPGGTEIGRQIRRILLERDLERDPVTELLLMCADRAEHVGAVIRPALEEGTLVITDRFAASTRAYQGAGLGIPAATIEAAIALATGGLEPNLTILFDVPGEIARDRRLSRAVEQNDIDRRSVEFHERVRLGFREQAAANPESWHVIDATQPLEEVVDQVLSVIDAAMARELRN